MNWKKTVRTVIKQDLNSGVDPTVLRYIGFLEKQKMQLPIQILLHLRLLLRSNGIKYLKNLFQRHAICLEGVLMQWLKKWWPYWINLLFCASLLILLLFFKSWLIFLISEYRDLIPGQITPKTQKWYLMPPCLTHRYWPKLKLRNQGKG